MKLLHQLFLSKREAHQPDLLSHAYGQFLASNLESLHSKTEYYSLTSLALLEPVLNIRRDVTRTATGGIRATVQPEKLLYRDGQLTGDKIELSYNQIMG